MNSHRQIIQSATIAVGENVNPSLNPSPPPPPPPY